MIKNLLTIILLLTLSACVSNPSKPDNRISEPLREKIADLYDKNDRQSNNPATLASLGDAYLQAYRQSRLLIYQRLALETLGKFLKLVPDNKPVKTMMYSLLMEQATHGDEQAESEAKRFFAEYPIIKQAGMAPPSYIEAVKLMNRNRNVASPENNTLLYAALKQSIIDAPKFYGAYMELGSAHMNAERYRLGEAIYIKGAKATEHPLLYQAAYEAIDLQVDNANSAGKCYMDYIGRYKQSLEYVRQWSKLMPKNAEALGSLAWVYSFLGRNRLALDAYKRSLQLSHNNEYAVFQADIYTVLTKPAKAREILMPLHESNLMSATESMGTLSLATQQWPEHVKMRQAMIKGGNKSPYNYFNMLIAQWLMGDEIGAATTLQAVSKLSGLKAWEKQLLSFYKGELSAPKLIGLADNICQQTEAEFAAGMMELKEDNRELAKQHFLQVKKQRVTRFVEYSVVVNLLKLMQ